MRKKDGRIKSFGLEGEGLGRVLGSLEQRVMEVAWRLGDVSIRDVWEELSERQRIAFNTVMTVMNRLVTKGLLRRSQESHSYRYSPVMSRERFLERVSREVAKGLVRDFGDYAVSQFVAALDEVDPAHLERLEKLLRERKGSDGGR